MAASAFRTYAIFNERQSETTGISLGSNTFKIALFRSTASTSNANTYNSSYYADLTAEHTTSGGGYTLGGETLASVAWTSTYLSTGATFDATDPVWTASTGGLSPKYAVIYASTSSMLVGFFDLETSGSTHEVAVTNTNTLTIQFSTSGIFTLTGATA